jgi:hypothetical protein
LNELGDARWADWRNDDAGARLEQLQHSGRSCERLSAAAQDFSEPRRKSVNMDRFCDRDGARVCENLERAPAFVVLLQAGFRLTPRHAREQERAL